MEEHNEDPRVAQELYFLIAKFLSDGPLKETAKTMLNELKTVEVLPRRLDWLGREHVQGYEDLLCQFPEVSSRRLLDVCKRAIRLAQIAFQRSSLGLPPTIDNSSNNPMECSRVGVALETRLSLLSAAIRRDATIPSRGPTNTVRRLYARETGLSPGVMFSPRLLSSMQLQRRTLGHLSAVYCLLFDCTSRYVITGADDMLVKVWCARSGRPVTSLRGASAEITDVCVSADGARVAAGSTDRVVRVWELRSGALVAALAQHQGTITAVHWSRLVSSSVSWLASTSTDGSVCFWSSTSAGFLSRATQFLERTRPGQCPMICAAWSAGGGFLAAGSADHHVRIYAVSDKQPPARILESCAHTEAVDSVAWSSRGLKLLSGSKDGTAAVWSLRAAHWRHTLLRPEPLSSGPSSGPATQTARLKCTMVCWDRTDQLIVMAVSDTTLRVWCATSCRQVRCLRGHTDEVYVLEPHPTAGHVLLSAGHDGQLRTWDLATGEAISVFHNEIPGQGCGAIFDAKWGSDVTIAASDSHGHVMLHGIGQGDPRFHKLPLELFFHTDYRPLRRDANGTAVDEQTGVEPHLLPPPLLVDVEGAPYPMELQTLVHGEDFEPYGAVEAIVAPPPAAEGNVLPTHRAGPWRGEGVRRAGELQPQGERPNQERLVTEPPLPSMLTYLMEQHRELHEDELSLYSREMRRRPLMISTEVKPRPVPRGKRPTRPWVQEEALEEEMESSGQTDTSDSSLRLSDYSEPRSSSSSSCSEWEGGTTLAPPTRTRRRPRQAHRYSPSVPSPKARVPRVSPTPVPGTPQQPGTTLQQETSYELPEAYRPGEWLTMTSPRKAPYHPQIGDECVYFTLGHQRYLEAVAEKDVYRVLPRDRPWETTLMQAAEFVKIIGIKYIIVPPRVAQLRVRAGGRRWNVKYHDMSDVIDFLVPTEHYRSALERNWGPGDRFRCLIDEHWWTGTVTERLEPESSSTTTTEESDEQIAARQFLALKVRWDNGEIERLSPWDLERLDPNRLPTNTDGGVPVTAEELASMHPVTWNCQDIVPLLDQIMSLSVAEPFLTPVDLNQDPHYAMTVPYPIDLATIRARLHNGFYRRMEACVFDARALAATHERAGRLLAPLLHAAIRSEGAPMDVVAEYRRLANQYRSSDDEELALAKLKSNKSSSWKTACADILRELCASSDAGPFLQPVTEEHAPDYLTVIKCPMDLGTVQTRLQSGQYTRRGELLRDVRQVFSNSRLYNTNKRTRIYSMTVRLSSLFEELWSRFEEKQAPRVRTRPRRTNRSVPARLRSSDSDEPLARRTPKGKGVGKSSRKPPPPSPPSPELNIEFVEAEEAHSSHNGYCGVGEQSECDEPSRLRDRTTPNYCETQATEGGSRKRGRRRWSEHSSGDTHRKVRFKHTHSHSSVSSSSSLSTSASSSGQEPGSPSREWSDRSYRPKDSSDDDAPLQHLRDRQEESGLNGAGPSRVKRKRRVRARRVSYNEDSEDYALAHIGKRNRAVVRVSASDRLSANRSRREDPLNGEASTSRDEPLSISSRGRVRKLTLKARGLLEP